MGMAFELYDVKRYESGLYFVNQLNQRKKPFNEVTKIELETISPEISKVNKELTVYDEDYHFRTFNSNEFVKTVYQKLKERIGEMDSELGPEVVIYSGVEWISKIEYADEDAFI